MNITTSSSTGAVRVSTHDDIGRERGDSASRPDITLEMERLGTAIGNLGDLLRALVDRIAPVLSPFEPVTADRTVQLDSVRAPLAGVLLEYRDRIEDLVGLAGHALERVQL